MPPDVEPQLPLCVRPAATLCVLAMLQAAASSLPACSSVLLPLLLSLRAHLK